MAAVALSACGTSRATSAQTVTLGVIAPLSGGLAAEGLGIRNAVRLAVEQANHRHRLKGWKIEVSVEDDGASADRGADAATKLADDPSVTAVVGPLNSSVAEKAAPVLDRRGVVMISPANTDPALTRGADRKNPARPYDYYFRVAASDLVQGPFAAGFAYHTAGKRAVAVVHDTTTYGQDLALGFKTQFEKLGGRVPAVETVDTDTGDFAAVLTRIRRLNPDMVFFGGDYPAAARLRSQAVGQGVTVPFMGGYAILDPAYVTLAKDAAVGDFATSVGAATEQLPTARPFVAAYKAAGYVDPADVYGAYAYDAANAVIAALAKVLPGEPRVTDALRPRLRQALQDGALDGATGRVAFDRFGDRTTGPLTVYEVRKPSPGAIAWTPKETQQSG